MFPPVSTKDINAVRCAVEMAQQEMYPGDDRSFVPTVFAWAEDCFAGRLADYQPVDTQYHDLEHTLQGTLCMARLMLGRHRAKAIPVLPHRTFQLGILAILLHDTGYLKRAGDLEGTGAKYTETHVERSADFAALLLRNKGFPDPEIVAVQNMIFCTGVKNCLEDLPFASEEERITGFALGTSDLLGQMSAEDYIEKLPVLYEEFAEAVSFSHGGNSALVFKDAHELMGRTPGFWKHVVLPKLEGDFHGLFRFLNDPYPDGPNDYINRIEANVRKLNYHLEMSVRQAME